MLGDVCDNKSRQHLSMASKMASEVRPKECKHCGSCNVVRFGHYHGIQRFFCKDCRHKFVDSEALPGMQTPANQIALALAMYYEGMSLHSICTRLALEYNNFVSGSTVRKWIYTFAKKVANGTENYRPNIGDVWVADETVLKIPGKNVFFWDIIDVKTRFLLASQMCLIRTSSDARILMKKASERAGRLPTVVLSDKLQAYLDGIELAFGGITKHISAKGLAAEDNINNIIYIESFRGSLRDRLKVMERLRRRASAEIIMESWPVYYNYLKRPDSLGDKTPAEKAGIEFQPRNWLDIIRRLNGKASTVNSLVEKTPPSL